VFWDSQTVRPDSLNAAIATKPADLDTLSVYQVEILQHFRDADVALIPGRIGRHAQLGGIGECLVGCQLAVEDVLLCT
jgi:hypothetical protein